MDGDSATKNELIVITIHNMKFKKQHLSMIIRCYNQRTNSNPQHQETKNTDHEFSGTYNWSDNIALSYIKINLGKYLGI